MVFFAVKGFSLVRIWFRLGFGLMTWGVLVGVCLGFGEFLFVYYVCWLRLGVAVCLVLLALLGLGLMWYGLDCLLIVGIG